jgi:hypothetical protein
MRPQSGRIINTKVANGDFFYILDRGVYLPGEDIRQKPEIESSDDDADNPGQYTECL